MAAQRIRGVLCVAKDAENSDIDTLLEIATDMGATVEQPDGDYKFAIQVHGGPVKLYTEAEAKKFLAEFAAMT